MNTTRRVLQKSKLVAAAAAALFAVGCGGSSNPPAGSGSSSAGTNAGSGSNGSSGGSGSTSTSTSGSGGSSAGSSGGSSGSPQPGVVSGTITYNGQAFTHPGWVGLFDQMPQDGVTPTVLVQTDSAGSYSFTLDGGGGTFYLGAAYAPRDGGALYDDGGVASPYFDDGGNDPNYVGQGLLGFYPVTSDGGDLTASGDISDLRVAAESLTVDASDLVDGGVPGGTTLPDGGELFPLILASQLGGIDPVANAPVGDASLVTVTPAGGSPLGMAYNGANLRYEYNAAIFTLNSWKPATDGSYVFTVNGSALIGTDPYTRQIDVHPLPGVPKIIAPASGDTVTAGKITVSWDDTTGADADEIDVYKLPASTGGAEQLSCRLSGLPTNGVQDVGLNQACNVLFSPASDYRIEVIGSRRSDQAQGTSIEAGYNRVIVHG